MLRYLARPWLDFFIIDATVTQPQYDRTRHTITHVSCTHAAEFPCAFSGHAEIKCKNTLTPMGIIQAEPYQ